MCVFLMLLETNVAELFGSNLNIGNFRHRPSEIGPWNLPGPGSRGQVDS